MRFTLFIIACFLAWNTPVLAEGSAMKYLARPQKPTPPTPPTAQLQKETEEQTPAQHIWAKYKELAAGTASQNKPAPAEPIAKEQTTSAPATGLADLINQYHENKKKQSQMQTLTITPAKPITEKQ